MLPNSARRCVCYITLQLIKSVLMDSIEVLRRSAEATMHSLVRTVFSRLNALDATEAEEQLLQDEEKDSKRVEAAEAEKSTQKASSSEAPRAETELSVASTPVPSASPRAYIVYKGQRQKF